ncbi:MAG: hypothetical protein NVS1B11_12690 [Terriglobales bacterium]
MKQVGIALILCAGLILAGCSSSSNNNNINGNWTASLTNPDGSPAFAFTTSLQSSGSVVSGTNLSFTTSSNCFASGSTETGSFNLSGNFNGSVTGSFGLTIQSGTPSGNTLTLKGAVKSNTIVGTWNLTGTTAGCTGSGNFTMNKN